MEFPSHFLVASDTPTMMRPLRESMKGPFVLRNPACYRFAALLALGLVCVGSRVAMAQQAPVVASQPDQPVPAEARSTSAVASDAVYLGALPLQAGSDAARVVIPTDNSGIIERTPPAKVFAQAPPLGTSFEGIPDTGFSPANPNIAVGPNKIVQTVSGALRVTDRLGFAAEATIPLNFLLGVPAGSTGLFAPVCVFDHFANRFVVMCSARNAAGTDGWYVLAVSKSPIPLADPAAWTVYFIRNDITLPNTDTATWGDYAKLGFDNANF